MKSEKLNLQPQPTESEAIVAALRAPQTPNTPLVPPVPLPVDTAANLSTSKQALKDKHCVRCKVGSPAIAKTQAKELLKKLPDWELDLEAKTLSRLFSFESYWAGLGFVNAVAWIAQSEQHHPDMELLYKKVKLRFTTHTVNGLSENDFICAAKVNALMP